MAHVEKRADRKYRARYRTPGGQERSKTFTTKREAERFLASVENDKATGRWTDPRLARVTFAEVARRADAASIGRRATTRARDETLMRTRVLPTFGGWQLDEITRGAVRAWVASLVDSGLAPATVRKCYQLLARVLDDALEDGLLAVTPCRGISLPAERRAEPVLLTPAHVDAISEAVPERYQALILTGAFTGLRWGELAGLRVSRVNMLRRRIDVAEILVEVNGTMSFGPPKTAKSRNGVSFPPFLADVLAAHMAQFPDPDSARGLVFTSDDGTPLRRSNFRRRVWLPALDATDAPKEATFHALRHATASWLIDSGANPLQVAERLRHTRVQTTMSIYAHLFEGVDEHLDAILEERRVESVRPRPGRGMLQNHG